MKKLFILLVALASAAAATAQQKADIIVKYKVRSLSHTNDSIQTSDMTLLANNNEAKFFNDLSLWNDSLASTPEGKEQLRQIIMAACMTKRPDGSISVDLRKGPAKKEYTYVFTNLANSKLRYYSRFGDGLSYYDEPLSEMQWQIGDSSRTVLGYECIEATTDYHGRTWTAWFAPELPASFGPWKFHGLPGLVLAATSDNGIEYTAIGIEKSDRPITPMYTPDQYSKTDRKKALAEHEYYYNNWEAIMKAKHGGNVKIANIDHPKYIAAKHAAETDY